MKMKSCKDEMSHYNSVTNSAGVQLERWLLNKILKSV